MDDEACIKCDLCSLHCQTQAQPFPIDEWRSGECIYCVDCASLCPTKAIHFPLSARFEKAANVSDVDLSRRKLLLTTIAGLVAVPFFRITQSHKRASDKLLRPPGSLPKKVPGPLRQVRRVHEGLPDRRPAAGPDRGRAGRDVDAGAGAQDRLLRVLLLALLPGLPDGGHQGADRAGEDQGQDRHGLDRQEPLPALLPGPAVHRLRGALPDLAQGHPVHRVRVAAPTAPRPSTRRRSSTSSCASAAASARTSAR